MLPMLVSDCLLDNLPEQLNNFLKNLNLTGSIDKDHLSEMEHDMSMDGSHLGCDIDEGDAHGHPAMDERKNGGSERDEGRPRSPDDCLHMTPKQENRPNSRPSMNFDPDSRPSVIESAKAPQAIECT